MCNNNNTNNMNKRAFQPVVSEIPTFFREEEEMICSMKRSGVSSLFLSSLSISETTASTSSTTTSTTASSTTPRESKSCATLISSCSYGGGGGESNCMERKPKLLRRCWGSHNLTSLSDNTSASSKMITMTLMKKSNSCKSYNNNSAATLSTICDYEYDHHLHHFDDTDDSDTIGNAMEVVVDSWGYFVDTNMDDHHREEF